MILSYLVFLFATTPSKSDHAVNFKIEIVFFSRMNFGGKISLNYGAATLDSSAGFCLDRPLLASRWTKALATHFLQSVFFSRLEKQHSIKFDRKSALFYLFRTKLWQHSFSKVSYSAGLRKSAEFDLLGNVLLCHSNKMKIGNVAL